MPTPVISLLPDKLDLKLYAGDGVAIQLSITDNLGVALPIGELDEFSAQIRQARLDEDPLVEFNWDLTDADAGIITLSLQGTQTASLITDEAIFKGYWDVQWVRENQEPVTIVQGKVECDADVTR